MSRDFFSTAAQVLPVLLLALVWESRYLERLPAEQRFTRLEDPVHGVRFWAKSRVWIWALTVVTVTICAIAICLLVLAGLVPGWAWLGFATVVGLGLALVSLMYRIWTDIVVATRLIRRNGRVHQQDHRTLAACQRRSQQLGLSERHLEKWER